ncbi:hypothetical protein GCM10008983_10830 [Lentibacillus halophilus]|uniref:Polyhydroxyalkanoate synthesis regulator phasin n=1 Tax=Lentibacillus halophilus TaxID=295065 RepID=A0ABP3J0C1_9BACI
MSDFLRKGFLLGLGAAITGKEKVDEKLQVLVDKGELTQDEARSMLRDLANKGESKTDEWNEKSQEQLQSFAHDLGLATKEDIDRLEARLTELESKENERS